MNQNYYTVVCVYSGNPFPCLFSHETNLEDIYKPFERIVRVGVAGVQWKGWGMGVKL